MSNDMIFQLKTHLADDSQSQINLALVCGKWPLAKGTKSVPPPLARSHKDHPVPLTEVNILIHRAYGIIHKRADTIYLIVASIPVFAGRFQHIFPPIITSSFQPHFLAGTFFPIGIVRMFVKENFVLHFSLAPSRKAMIREGYQDQKSTP